MVTLRFLESSIQQLKALGQHLSQTYFDAAYSSDLPRAVHTAQIILEQNQHPISLQETPALREWRLGRLEGRKNCGVEGSLSGGNEGLSS